MNAHPTDLGTARSDGLRTGPEPFGRTSEENPALQNTSQTQIFTACQAFHKTLAGKLADKLHRELPVPHFNPHSRVARAKFEPPPDDSDAFNYGTISFNPELVHTDPQEFGHGFMEATLEHSVWCERVLWETDPKRRKSYSRDYRGRDFRLWALRLELAAKINPCGKDTAANVVYRLVPEGRAHIIVLAILASPAFTQLQAAIPHRCETPEQRKRREDKNASHTAFVCTKCGAKFNAKPDIYMWCAHGSPDRPGDVLMVPVNSLLSRSGPSQS